MDHPSPGISEAEPWGSATRVTALAGKAALLYDSVLKLAAFGGSEWVLLSRGDERDAIDNDGFYP